METQTWNPGMSMEAQQNNHAAISVPSDENEAKQSSVVPKKTYTPDLTAKLKTNTHDNEADRDATNVTEELCVICLNPVASSSRGVASGCLHACFHFGCLATWLEANESQRKCPMCKNPVEFIKHDFDVQSTKFKKFYIRPDKADEPISCRSSHNSRHSRTPYTTNRSRHYRSSSPMSADDAILRRRYIYKHRLRSLHIGTNRRSRFQNFTPQIVCAQPELQSKAKAWIRRELHVFEWTEGNREWLLEYLCSIVKSVNLKAADGTAERLAAEFFGKDFAGVFVHELHAYLRSPFTRLQDFDNWAQYEKPVPKFLDGQAVVLDDPSDQDCELPGESVIGSSSS